MALLENLYITLKEGVVVIPEIVAGKYSLYNHSGTMIHKHETEEYYIRQSGAWIIVVPTPAGPPTNRFGIQNEYVDGLTLASPPLELEGSGTVSGTVILRTTPPPTPPEPSDSGTLKRLYVSHKSEEDIDVFPANVKGIYEIHNRAPLVYKHISEDYYIRQSSNDIILTTTSDGAAVNAFSFTGDIEDLDSDTPTFEMEADNAGGAVDVWTGTLYCQTKLELAFTSVHYTGNVEKNYSFNIDANTSTDDYPFAITRDVLSDEDTNLFRTANLGLYFELYRREGKTGSGFPLIAQGDYAYSFRYIDTINTFSTEYQYKAIIFQEDLQSEALANILDADHAGKFINIGKQDPVGNYDGSSDVYENIAAGLYLWRMHENSLSSMLCIGEEIGQYHYMYYGLNKTTQGIHPNTYDIIYSVNENEYNIRQLRNQATNELYDVSPVEVLAETFVFDTLDSYERPIYKKTSDGKTFYLWIEQSETPQYNYISEIVGDTTNCWAAYVGSGLQYMSNYAVANYVGQGNCEGAFALLNIINPANKQALELSHDKLSSDWITVKTRAEHTVVDFDIIQVGKPVIEDIVIPYEERETVVLSAVPTKPLAIGIQLQYEWYVNSLFVGNAKQITTSLSRGNNDVVVWIGNDDGQRNFAMKTVYVQEPALDMRRYLPTALQENEVITEFIDAISTTDIEENKTDFSVVQWLAKIRELSTLIDPYQLDFKQIQRLGKLFHIRISNTTPLTVAQSLLSETIEWYKEKGTYGSLDRLFAMYNVNNRLYENYATIDDNSFGKPEYTDKIPIEYNPDKPKWFIGDVGKGVDASAANPKDVGQEYVKISHLGISTKLDRVYDKTTVIPKEKDEDGKLNSEAKAATFGVVIPNDFLWYPEQDFNMQGQFETIRPINVVPQYSLYMEAKTTEDKLPYRIRLHHDNADKYSYITTKLFNWQASSYFFDAKDSETGETEWSFDDGSKNIRFDLTDDGYLDTIVNWRISKKYKDDSFGTGWGISETDCLIGGAFGNNVSWRRTDTAVIFSFTVPKETILGYGKKGELLGASCLALYTDGNEELIVGSVFPDIYKSDEQSLSVEVSILRQKRIVEVDKPTPEPPEPQDNRPYILIETPDDREALPEGLQADVLGKYYLQDDYYWDDTNDSSVTDYSKFYDHYFKHESSNYHIYIRSAYIAPIEPQNKNIVRWILSKSLELGDELPTDDSKGPIWTALAPCAVYPNNSGSFVPLTNTGLTSQQHLQGTLYNEDKMPTIEVVVLSDNNSQITPSNNPAGEYTLDLRGDAFSIYVSTQSGSGARGVYYRKSIEDDIVCCFELADSDMVSTAERWWVCNTGTIGGITVQWYSSNIENLEIDLRRSYNSIIGLSFTGILDNEIEITTQ